MKSNTKTVPPGSEKFTLPEFPDFQGVAPLLSALSLLGFLVASIVALICSSSLQIWTRAPFLFTAIGSAIGFLYEFWLIASGRPYQLFLTADGRRVQWWRALLVVFVFGSIYLAYSVVTIAGSGHELWVVLGCGLLCGLLAVVLLFEGSPGLATLVFLLAMLGQLLLVWRGAALQGEFVAQWLLTAAAVSLFVSVLIGSATPQRSTVFHVIGAASVGLLYFGFEQTKELQRPQLESHAWAWFLLGFAGSCSVVFYAMPRTWSVLRSRVANMVWPLFYLLIAGGMRTPNPSRLSALYKGKEDQLKTLRLLPYYIAHPRNLTHKISVPCLDEALTLKVHAYTFLTRMVKYFFAIASFINRRFPFANTNVPLRLKPRMEPWSDGSHYWPRWLLRRLWLPGLGRFEIESGVLGPGFQPTPDKAIDAYLDGQLLAYLAEFGIAGSFLEAETNDEQVRFKLDFSFLESYETKPDYEPYGGVAYFVIDDHRKRMVLSSVRLPQSQQEIPVDVNNATFRRAESLILASLYFYVVSGKHLVEIHMGLNLIEVALFNAFDAKQQWGHPVRMSLYPHLFAHELAEELTTQQLLEDGAVFPQIFATTNAALMQHLNDRFSEYQLGTDEEFDRREKTLLTGRKGAALEDILPSCSLVWERCYAGIWRRYCAKLVDAAYAADCDVEKDECLQVLFQNLTDAYVQPLPAKYSRLATKAGLISFLADTMHHLIIRHEVYGTSGVRLSLDPRINQVQVPKDGGPPAIDEWRSLACVAMATSRVRYTKLMGNFENVFSDIEDEAVLHEFRLAHVAMKAELQRLEEAFLTDGVDNYQMLRLLPSDLDIGAGY